MNLLYTGEESLQLVKEHFPNNWKVEVAAKQKILLQISKTYNISPKAAAEKFIDAGCSKVSGILMCAAYYKVITSKEYKSTLTLQAIRKLEEDQNQVSTQITSLDNQQNGSFKDTGDIRTFLVNKQTQLQNQINEHINSFEVVSPEIIVTNHELFDNLN